MDDLDLINSVQQVEVMVNSIQKGAENQKTSALIMLENLLGIFLICSTLFQSRSNLHEFLELRTGEGRWQNVPPSHPSLTTLTNASPSKIGLNLVDIQHSLLFALYTEIYS